MPDPSPLRDFVTNSCVLYDENMDLINQSQFENYMGIPHSGKDWRELSPFFDDQALCVSALSAGEVQEIELTALNRIVSDTQRVGTEERRKVWHDGWKENLDLYQRFPSWLALQPRYYTSVRNLRSPVTNFPVFRIGGTFVTSQRLDFEIHMAEAHRSLMFNDLASSLRPTLIVELGCGPGLNLLALARAFPDVALVAADFVPSALTCAKLVAQRHEIPLQVMDFDFRNPRELDLPMGALVVTMGALEQLGHGPTAAMVEWILKQRGVSFFHSEPFVEMYDSSSTADHLLREFALRRGYTQGLLPVLREANSSGRISSFQESRVLLGSGLLEGYNWVTYTVL